MSASTVLVIASGADVALVRDADPHDFVICADGGLDVALEADRGVDLVIGDLDSVSEEALAVARAGGADIERHPADKDESDLELALGAAVSRAPSKISVHLASGGRLDHQLANLLVLASPRWAATALSAVVGRDRVWVVRGSRVLPIGVGAPLALHAIGGPAEGVRTDGLRFDLHDEPLAPMVARGISNEVRRDTPRITVQTGVVLVVASSTED